MNRRQRRANARKNGSTKATSGSRSDPRDDMNIPTTLKQICEMRDRNWEALKGQEAHISRIIENAPQTQEDVEFVMKILVVALSEVMVRAQIELQVNKVLDSRGQ